MTSIVLGAAFFAELSKSGFFGLGGTFRLFPRGPRVAVPSTGSGALEARAVRTVVI